MTYLKICRICLQTSGKLYKDKQFHLDTYYIEILSLKDTNHEGLPKYFCFECAAMLHKFHKFKEKCDIGRKVLIDLLQDGTITYKSIQNIDRTKKKLESNIKIITIDKCKVQTLAIEYKNNDNDDNDFDKMETEPMGIETVDVYNTGFSEEDITNFTSDKEVADENKFDTLCLDVKVKNDPDDDALSDTRGADNFADIENSYDDTNSIDIKKNIDDIVNNIDDDSNSIDIKNNLNDNEENNDDDANKIDIKNIFDNSEVNNDKDTNQIYIKHNFDDMDLEDNDDTTLIDIKNQIEAENNKEFKEKKVVKHKSKPLTKKAKGAIKRKEKEKKLRFMREKKRDILLDENYWKKIVFSEEDAVKEFKARAKDKKFKEAAFQCHKCYKGFSKDEMLSRHMKLRHDESIGAYKCNMCHMRFRHNFELGRHTRSHYTKFQCQRCDIICPIESTAMIHEEFHRGVKRKCEYCACEFSHVTTYYTHLRTHRSDFVCTLCGASFVSNMGLHQHKRVKHGNGKIMIPEDEKEETYCAQCDIRFETRNAYNEHLLHSALHAEENEVGKEPSILMSLLDKDKQKEDTGGGSGDRKPDKSKVKVSVARKTTVRKRKFGPNSTSSQANEDGNGEGKLSKGGVKVSSARKAAARQRKMARIPTTCYQCGVQFATQAACRKHHQAAHPRTSFHPPTNRHICEICGASLAPGSMAVHLISHSQEKKFECETCGNKFCSKMTLKRHYLTHTGEKPYKCTLCEKRFTQNNSMQLHYKTFHLKLPYPKRNRWKKKDLDPADSE